MASGFKTFSGLKIYLNYSYFFNYISENLGDEYLFLKTKTFLRKIEYLFELPRCFSIYLLFYFMFYKVNLSFQTNMLIFLFAKFLGILFSRIHWPKPFYSFFNFISIPFQAISFNFYIPYVFIITYCICTQQILLFLAYLSAFIIFYIFDGFLTPPFVMYHTKNKYGMSFLGSELVAFIVFYNECNVSKIYEYNEFVEDYCYWTEFDPVLYVDDNAFLDYKQFILNKK